MPAVDTIILDAEQMSRLSTRRGWLRKDLAEAAGISTARTSAAFKGRPVGPRVAKKIANALGVKITKLIASDRTEPASAMSD